MIYLDNAATTPIAPKVLEAMMPYLTEYFGNAGSIHSLGRDAKQAVEKARKQVADFIGAKPEQIIFTSGGTEANNLAILGVRDYLLRIGKTHIVTSPVEHKSVLNAVEALKKPLCHNKKMCIKDEFDTSFLKVDKFGIVSPYELIKTVWKYENVGLVSVMCMNNELGSVNDVAAIGEFCRESGILFHTDCVQAAGCNDINVERIKCDLMSISSHKIHGPKGIGALYVRDKEVLSAIINGGVEQEYGLRGGTENVAGVVGFGAACELAHRDTDEHLKTTSYYRRYFFDLLYDNFKKSDVDVSVSFNGMSPCYPGKVLSLTFHGIDAETLVLMLDAHGVCVSAGSACQSHESNPSHVLKAIGLTDEDARSTIRISFSEFNTEEEVRYAAIAIIDCVKSLERCGKT